MVSFNKTIITALLLLVCTANCIAEEVAITQISSLAEMPAAGTELIISFKVSSTNNNLSFLLLGSSDQQNFALKPDDVISGIEEQTITFKILSPLASIEYFLLVKEEGQAISSSKHFTASRKCLSKVSEVDVLTADKNSPKQAELLMERIKQLQIDIENYQAVLHQLKRINLNEQRR